MSGCVARLGEPQWWTHRVAWRPSSAIAAFLASISGAGEAAIREAAAADRLARLQIGEVLSRPRHRNVHRAERDRRGRPIPTELSRWEAYLRRWHPQISKPEAAALMTESAAKLLHKFHLQEGG